MAAGTPQYEYIRAKEFSLPVLTNYSECYVELGVIGEGTFGNVVMARRIKDGLIVAIKSVRIYSKHLLDNVRKAMREVVIIKKLANVDVPIIYDQFLRYNEAKQLLFSIVMEYIEGGNMELVFQNFIQTMNLGSGAGRQRQRTFLQQFVPWLYQNLNNMHQQGIVHRDIKPSNIMYRSNPLPGQSLYVLVDLGFGCVVEGLKTLRVSPGLFKRKVAGIKVDDLNDIMRQIDQTCETDRFIGTVIYLPPEAFSDEEGFVPNLRSYDIWAAAVVLHEFIHLEPIFTPDNADSANLDQMIAEYAEEVNIPITCRYIPPYDRIVMESTSLESSLRPSAAQIFDFLTAWAGGIFLTEIRPESFNQIYLEH